MDTRKVVGVVLVVAVLGIMLGVRHGLNRNSENEAGQGGATSVSQNPEGVSGSSSSAAPILNSRTATAAERTLSDAVKTLLGLDGDEQNYNSMKRAVSALSKNLSGDDVDALREMLDWPNDRFPEGMRDIEINAVKNDVLDRLLRQNKLPEGIGMQLVDMASNSSNDPVWRDYCIQFMTPFYERATLETSQNTDAEKAGRSSDELKAVREAMVSALDEREGTLAGTALIGLELLSRSCEEFDRDAIIAKASEIAADESASSGVRMTAMRMSSLTGGDETSAQTARNLAQTGETAYLRSAALVTLGETGSADDRELIESYVGSENKQIAAAAKLALQKMDARNL
ncbi:MAG: hypothetical protein JXR25_10165 [Pontiellaceae bacterium]|nr:hypothetical protein [Pontiellaceae bacterium]MBN2785183.1 hypothetical protein [Pontiellaceae bacterium]